MNEVLATFLDQLSNSGMNATALRALKKDFRAGIDPIIRKAVGDPSSRKRARLETKLAAIQAQIDAANTPNEDV